MCWSHITIIYYYFFHSSPTILHLYLHPLFSLFNLPNIIYSLSHMLYTASQIKIVVCHMLIQFFATGPRSKTATSRCIIITITLIKQINPEYINFLEKFIFIFWRYVYCCWCWFWLYVWSTSTVLTWSVTSLNKTICNYYYHCYLHF